nr:hypothetical protein [Mycolicibacterium murale]
MSHEVDAATPTSQAAEPSASPKAVVTDSRVARSISSPPNRRGVNSRNIPFSSSASITSSAVRR